MAKAHSVTIVFHLAWLLCGTLTPADAKEDCKPDSQTAKCCAERKGAWVASDEGGYCFEKLPLDEICFEPMVAEDTELVIRCTKHVIDPGGSSGRSDHFVVVNQLALPLDTIEFDIGNAAGRRATAVELPDGWSSRAEKDRLVVSGPPTPGPFRLRFDLQGASLSKKIDVRLRADGKIVAERKGFTVPTLPPAQTSGSLSGIVVMPPVVSPGETVQAVVRDEVKAPPGGTWTIGGTVIDDRDSEPEDGDAGRRILNLPRTLPPGLPLTLTYIDRFGRTLLDVPAVDRVEVIPEQPPVSGPSLNGGGRHATAGGEICVCGDFPGPAAWSALTLDDEPLGDRIAASSRGVTLPLPSEIALGPYTVAGQTSAGFSPEDRWIFEVITVQAELDQQELLSGGSTQLRLRVRGTEDPIAVSLTNRTPSIIRIEGGDQQVLETTGGDPNAASQTVRALSRGAFDISWEMVPEPCPCGESTTGSTPSPRPYLDETIAERVTPKVDPERLEMAQGLCQQLEGAAPSPETEAWQPFCAGDTTNFRVYGYQCVGSKYGNHAGACATTWIEQWLNDLPSCEFLPHYAALCEHLGGRYSHWVATYSLF